MEGKKIENVFDIIVHIVKENSHIPVIELNVFSPLPGHKYLVENLFDITVHRVKKNSHLPVIEFNVFSPLPGHKYLVGGNVSRDNCEAFLKTKSSLLNHG